MCTKLRSGVLVGLPSGHRRQAVKCPRAPFSWKPSAESEKKSAMVRRSSSIARNYRGRSLVRLSPPSQPRVLRHVTISRHTRHKNPLKSACHESLTPPPAGVLTTPRTRGKEG